MSRLLRLLVPLALVGALAFAVPAGGQAEPDLAKNMSLIVNVPGVENPATPGVSFTNTDLAFWGTKVFAGDVGGFRIFQTSRPARPKLLANVRCAGSQGDISVWGDLLFQSLDSPRTGVACSSGPASPSTPGMFEGIRIFDISDLRNPSLITGVRTDCGSHTHTLVPDLANGRVLVYVSSYALTTGSLGPDCLADTGTTKGHNKISIVSVPLGNPAAAAVIAEPALDPGTQQFDGNAAIPGLGLLTTTGCHDITVFMELEIAGAACMGEGQIWDISDPAHPKTTGRVFNPNVEFWHSATFSQDGKRVIFGDEAGGGTGPACTSKDPATRGALWFYDVRQVDSLDEEVVEPRSSWKVPRIQEKLTPDQAQDPNCTMHNFNTLPTKHKDLVVSSAYAAGTTMVDFTSPSNPKEVGYLDPHGANTWSAYWYNGHIFTNDGGRGVDILTVKDQATKGSSTLPFSNPQTMMSALP